MFIAIYDEKTGQVTSRKSGDDGIVRHDNLLISPYTHDLDVRGIDFCLSKTNNNETSIEFIGATMLTATLDTCVLLCVDDEIHRLRCSSKRTDPDSLWVYYEYNVAGTSVDIKFLSGSLIGRDNTVLMLIKWYYDEHPTTHVLEKFW
jgi:hypothetical protein